jgi:hypothetical protein
METATSAGFGGPLLRFLESQRNHGNNPLYLSKHMILLKDSTTDKIVPMR